MRAAATEPVQWPQSGRLYLVGYGNALRRDDGVGRFVVDAVEKRLGPESTVSFRTDHQPDPSILEDLAEAELVVMVDATVENLPEGTRWERLVPGPVSWSSFGHDFNPGRLAGLLWDLYRAKPEIWLVAVEGRDFGFGEGLAPETERRALRLIDELVDFFAKEERNGRRS